MTPMPKATELLKRLIDSYNRCVSFIPAGPEEALSYQVDKFLVYKDQIEEPRKLLDHGFVRLVNYMGNDLSIVRAARVSYNADWRVGDEATKGDIGLIKYLLTNKHTSPFETVLFTFEFKVPIFVARQHHRHRTWSYDEVSARYTELPEEFYVPALDKITTQSKDNKQARTNEQHPDALYFQSYIRKVAEAAFAQYKEFLDMGCPRELARGILPLNTYTRYFGTVNLHNLLHFLNLRLHSHAQYEIRVYAEAILDIIKEIVPVTIDAWQELRK